MAVIFTKQTQYLGSGSLPTVSSMDTITFSGSYFTRGMSPFKRPGSLYPTTTYGTYFMGPPTSSYDFQNLITAKAFQYSGSFNYPWFTYVTKAGDTTHGSVRYGITRSGSLNFNDLGGQVGYGYPVGLFHVAPQSQSSWGNLNSFYTGSETSINPYPYSYDACVNATGFPCSAIEIERGGIREIWFQGGTYAIAWDGAGSVPVITGSTIPQLPVTFHNTFYFPLNFSLAWVRISQGKNVKMLLDIGGVP